MKVLVINRGPKTDNVGDQAICLTLEKIIEKYGNVSSIDSINFTYFFDGKNKLKNILNMIAIAKKNYNVVLVGGGQLIQSNRKFPLSFFLWVFFIKIFSSSKIHLFCIGADRHLKLKGKIIYRLMMSQVNSAYVRDGVSRDSLKNNFKFDSTIIHDPVFLLGSLLVIGKSKSEEKNGIMLFGITNYSTVNRYRFMDLNEKQYLEEMSELFFSHYKNHRKSFLIYNANSDLVYTKIFKKHLFEKFKIKISIMESERLTDYIKNIEASTTVISGRMHALIIAKTYNVENIVPIIRNEKLEVFSELLEHYNIIEHEKKMKKAIQVVLNDY